MSAAERSAHHGGRRYPVNGDGGRPTPPDYGRIVSRLSNDELRAELGRAKSLPEETHGDYCRALEAERRRRRA